MPSIITFLFFFFNDPATTEIYTLSLHDALPISLTAHARPRGVMQGLLSWICACGSRCTRRLRSEEHTSELQSRPHLVCRLLLEKIKHNMVDDRRRKSGKP